MFEHINKEVKGFRKKGINYLTLSVLSDKNFFFAVALMTFFLRYCLQKVKVFKLEQNQEPA